MCKKVKMGIKMVKKKYLTPKYRVTKNTIYIVRFKKITQYLVF